jgi:outer membrane protein assembly factor BamB
MVRSTLLGGLLLSLAATSGLIGADLKSTTRAWPQFRGPNRDGICQETDLLEQWPKEGPPLAWQATGMGQGFSSVAITGGKIFTMGDRPAQGRDQSCHVIALDQSTGKEVWAARVGAAFPHNRGSGPRCTPTIDGDLLYALSPAGDLVCLETATGRERWRKSFSRDFAGRMMSGWGFSESPLVDGEKLVCTPGGNDATLVALDKTTGRVIWRGATPERDRAAYSSIVTAEVGGIRQYIQSVSGGIIGIAAEDGRFLWRYNKVANGTANIPSPIVRGDLVFASNGYSSGSALLRLVPTGNGIKAEEVYLLPARELQNHHGGLVLVGEHLYGGHGHNAGNPVCAEFRSGKVVWKDRGAGSNSAAVLFADGHLYFRYGNGVMALVEATPQGYKEKGKFKLPYDSGQPNFSHPVIVDGKLYLRDQDTLLCFDVRAKG